MMEVVYRNTLPANAQLVAGSYPHGALPRGALAGAVTTQMAARFGLHPGSRVVLTIPTGPVRIVITAIVRIRGPNSSFWAKDSTVGLPSRVTGPDTCNCWAGSVFADPDQFVAMQNALGSSSIDIQWVYPLATGGVGADGAQALLDDLNRASTVPVGLTGCLRGRREHDGGHDPAGSGGVRVPGSPRPRCRPCCCCCSSA